MMLPETKNNRILIVDDEEEICKLVQGILQDEGYDAEYALNVKSALKLFSEKRFDIAILDIWLSDGSDDGIVLMQELLKTNLTLPIIMMSGHSTVETAVEAIKKGAYDFIEKPFKTDRLLVIVQRGLELSKLKNENKKLKNNGQTSESINLAGNSKALKEFKNKLNEACNSSSSDRSVIIFSKDTKEAIKTAKYIHSNSPINNISMACFDCSKANEDNISSFFKTNKDRRNILSNLDKLPNNFEQTLLSNIKNSKYHPIFVSETSNCAFVCNATKPLRIESPDLSERIEDIKDLIDFYYINNGGEASLSSKFTGEAIDALKEYRWSGGLTQLNNFVEWLTILKITKKNKIDQGNFLPYFMDKKKIAVQANQSPSILQDNFLDVPLKPAREIFEVAYLQEQLVRFNYNISKVSSFIEMERSALHRKLKSLNIATSNDTSSKNQKTIQKNIKEA